MGRRTAARQDGNPGWEVTGMETTTPTTRSDGEDRAHRVDAVDDVTALRVVLVRLQRQLRAHVGGALTPSQASVLARIEHEGPMRMGALAEAEGTSAATVSRLVDTLETQCLVVRVPDPVDGRASVVQLSGEGARFLEQLRSRSTEVLRRAFEQVGVDERTAIARALPALAALTEHLHCLDADRSSGAAGASAGSTGNADQTNRRQRVRPER
ncbi:MAG: MarR family winged helix-turn-helix transcriptional regulator [Acidimicrobiales bacterium]